MKKIPLTQGQFALVDDEDYAFLMQWKWCAQKVRKTFYAIRSVGSRSKKKTILMHRLLICRAEEKRFVDHRDTNGLNNQRFNLRICSRVQNGYNSNIQSNNTSGYKGVVWNKRHQKWQARISNNGRKIYLGTFSDKVTAALAYDAAARAYAGDYARPNFPNE